MDSPEADTDDGSGVEEDAQLLSDLKRRLMPSSRRSRETRPPVAGSAAMDVHGLPSNEREPTWLQEVLATALGGEAAKRAVGKEMRQAHRRNRVLEAPIKLIEAKSHRIAAYETANKDLGRWYGYVERNRLSQEVSFPLPATGAPRPQSAADYHQRARADIAVGAAGTAGAASDDLESRLYRRLYSEAAIANAAGLAQPQPRQGDLQQLDGGKVRERLASARRLSARRHFLEEKLKRQARIKSKAYRRHARRAKLKQEVAELESLKDSDPAGFAERMAALERARAEERISQRHRGGSRFARDQKLRARFDDSAREAVQEMIRRGKDLTEKTEDADGSGDSDGDEDEGGGNDGADAQLPDDLLDDWNRVRGGDGFQDEEQEVADDPVPVALRPGKTNVSSSSVPAASVKERNFELDLSHLPELPSSSALDQDGDAVESSGGAATATCGARRLARMRTDELLAEDCEGRAKEEFEKEKADVANQEQPKDVDLFLPGWNTWTGPGTRPVPADRRERFLIKAPKRDRRDAVHGHVIIREKLESGTARRRHLVKEVPFPYANAEQFEHAMRTPVCRDFNSIMAHKRLTAPRVSVAMGRAIGPVSKDAILRRRRKQRSNAEIARGTGKKESK